MYVLYLSLDGSSILPTSTKQQIAPSGAFCFVEVNTVSADIFSTVIRFRKYKCSCVLASYCSPCVGESHHKGISIFLTRRLVRKIGQRRSDISAVAEIASQGRVAVRVSTRTERLTDEPRPKTVIILISHGNYVEWLQETSYPPISLESNLNGEQGNVKISNEGRERKNFAKGIQFLCRASLG